MSSSPLLSKSYTEFERESLRIDELVWAAMAIAPQSRVLFLGFANSRAVMKRALRDGVAVTVVESDPNAIREAESLGLEVVRASSSGLPFRPESFDVAVAHYYLHETDPSFHPQVILEMTRVARRVAVIEPGPPADLLGSRIASLYARAKRDLGQFEQYQSIDYWRRMLAAARPVVVPLTISYGSMPPRAFLRDTMRMMLDLMRIGGVSASDLNEMRALANASDAQMLPQPRYVLLAAATSADIPERPRVQELESMAPNRLPLREHERLARSSRAPKLPNDMSEPAMPATSEINSIVTPITPIAPFNKPQARSFVPPAIVEAVTPTAQRAASPAANQLNFGVPAIQPGEKSVENLFKKRGDSWNSDEAVEMPDFGIPGR